MCQSYELKMTRKALLRHCRAAEIHPLAMHQGETMQPGAPVLMLASALNGWSSSLVRWGLVGHFLAAEPPCPPLTLCGEGLVAKPFYSKILQRKRCLIPATAFFASQMLAGGGKRLVRLSQAGGKPMMFAGIFDLHPLVGPSCAIVTRQADTALGLVPDRIPVILDEVESGFWLGDYAEFPEDEFEALLAGGSSPALNAEAMPEPEISPQLAFAFA
nr:SOS response-associated peptidase family protein [Dechloromonas sp.]